MSRRDTIILAVLLNTALLSILFVIAINPDTDYFSDPIEIQSAIVEVENSEPEKQVAPVILAQESGDDEVDNVLKDFAATLNLEPVASNTKSHSSDNELIAFNSPTKYRRHKAKEESPLEASQSQQEYVEVTVKRGDILGRIAQANNTTVSQIKRVNNLTSDTLQIGQVLRVPVGTKSTSRKIASISRESISGDGYTRFYTIQSGDNPWKIAKKFDVSVRELLRMNDLDEAKARNLRPGDRVRVQ